MKVVTISLSEYIKLKDERDRLFYALLTLVDRCKGLSDSHVLEVLAKIEKTKVLNVKKDN